MNFSEWLVSELEKRGWSRSEAARRGNISPSMFDKVINGYAKPGVKFLDGVAQAFDISPINVYRKAGLLPTDSTENKVNFEDWKELIEGLNKDDQEDILVMIRAKLKRKKEISQDKSYLPPKKTKTK